MKNNLKNLKQQILDELNESLSSIEADSFDRLTAAVLRTAGRGGKVYGAAAGRMLFVMQGLVMRLNQMGIRANCVSDTYVEPISADDLVIALTSSGTTHTVVDFGLRAKEKTGAEMWMIGCNPDSPLAAEADGMVLFRPSGSTRMLSQHDQLPPITSAQPMNCLNEQTALLLFDALIMNLMNERGITGSDMNARHFNLE